MPDWLVDPEVRASLPWRLALASAVLVGAVVGVRLINWALSRTYWRRVTEGKPPELASELRRSKRQQTVLTVLQGLVRYVVFGMALVTAFGLLMERGLGAVLGGASIVAILVGFSLQRMFGDIVSGGLLLFESHYAVGDFIHVHGVNVAGIVDEFTLRTTVLRTLAGDRVVVLNGAIMGFTRYAQGIRDFRLEFLVEGDTATARAAIDRVVDRALTSPHQRFLLGPVVVVELPEPEPTPAGRHVTLFELRAVVPPTLEWLCEETLKGQLQVALEGRIVGEITLYAVDEPSFQAYRSSVLLPG